MIYAGLATCAGRSAAWNLRLESYACPDNASLTVNIFNLLVPLVVVIIIALELRLTGQL
jgi:hypothetical protein